MSTTDSDSNKDDIKTILAGVGGFTLILTYIAISLAWRGFVISTLWNWHVVGLLHDASLTIINGITILLIFEVLMGNSYGKARSVEKAKPLATQSNVWIIGGISLAIGWLIHVAL